MRRTLYLVIFTILVVVLALSAYVGYRHRGSAKAPSPSGAANCDTPAPPPPPKAAEPKLPDLLEAGCAPAANAPRPASATTKKK